MTGLTGIGQGHARWQWASCSKTATRAMSISVAARYPEPKILAGRPAWPGKDDMIAVSAAQSETSPMKLHGWSPKYFTPALKKEIGWRLQDRIMFGWDWPTLTLDRLTDDWRDARLVRKTSTKRFSTETPRLSSRRGAHIDDSRV